MEETSTDESRGTDFGFITPHGLYTHFGLITLAGSTRRNFANILKGGLVFDFFQFEPPLGPPTWLHTIQPQLVSVPYVVRGFSQVPHAGNATVMNVRAQQMNANDWILHFSGSEGKDIQIGLVLDGSPKGPPVDWESKYKK
jgi:hypothetical protein